MKKLTALLLTAVLAVSLLSGCGFGRPDPQITPQVTPTVTPTAVPTPMGTPVPTPVPTPDAPVAPETVVKPGTGGETQNVEAEISGETENITLSQITGSFASSGGPSFSLFVDAQRYQINDIDGYCYLTLRTGMSGDVYAELGYRDGSKPDDLAGTILNEYGFMQTVTDHGTVQLGAQTVRHVQGQTVKNLFDVFLLDTGTGCVTMVVSTTVDYEAHRDRLLTILETLQIY